MKSVVKSEKIVEVKWVSKIYICRNLNYLRRNIVWGLLLCVEEKHVRGFYDTKLLTSRWLQRLDSSKACRL